MLHEAKTLTGHRLQSLDGEIGRVNWDESKVFVTLNRSAIQGSPEYTEGLLLTREYETRLHGHYDRQGYWVDQPGHTVPAY